MGQDESATALPLDMTHLSFSRYKITKIPFFIPPDHPVTEIDAPYNSLQSFPMQLDHLESLDLSSNQLYTLGDTLTNAEFRFDSLKRLKLSANKLSVIPRSILTMKSLVELCLDRNQLTEFASELSNVQTVDLFLNLFEKFPSLPESVLSVNLGFNQIQTLDASFPHLRELKLSGNNLTEISSNTFLPELVSIDLSFNRLVSVPAISDFAPKLEILTLSFNFLGEFPTGVPVTVKKIDISHNCMSKWTDSLVELRNLKYLDVSYNDFEHIPELPPGIDKFIADRNKFSTAVPITPLGLKGLQLNSNLFRDIPVFTECQATHLLMRHNQIENIETDRICECIKHIDFTCNRIREIPVKLFSFQSLLRVMLTNNNISTIPEEIVHSNIEVLYISDNPISTLPVLPESLKEISACNCKFTELPEPLFNVPVLRLINMSSNQIESISAFPEVESLNLSQNLLSSIPPLPEFISAIDLSHNQLTEFIIDGDRPFLQMLDLSHNKLATIKLRSLPSLQIFKISHNPGLSYKLDLSLYPQIDTVDLFGTEIRHTPCVPTIRELVTTEPKLVRSGSNTQLKFYRGVKCGYAETIGTRPSMEDSLIIRESDRPKTPALYGVIDGHGGYKTSAIAASMIPELFEKLEKKSIGSMSDVLKQVNKHLSKLQVTDGATIVIATVAPTLVSVAHLGDARALIVRRDGTVSPLTYDHKPTERSELDVLKDGHAYVASGRLSSHLAVSRAIGDFRVDGVSRTPDVTTHEIGPDDIRLVLACDGVFDVMENEEVGALVARVSDIHRAAATVRDEAIIRGSNDNVSVIVIDIERPHETE